MAVIKESLFNIRGILLISVIALVVLAGTMSSNTSAHEPNENGEHTVLPSEDHVAHDVEVVEEAVVEEAEEEVVDDKWVTVHESTEQVCHVASVEAGVRTQANANELSDSAENVIGDSTEVCVNVSMRVQTYGMVSVEVR